MSRSASCWSDRGATPHAVAVMEELGLDLSDHRSRKIEGGIPGVAWARWGILAGALLTAVSILIPVTAALSRLTSGAVPE